MMPCRAARFEAASPIPSQPASNASHSPACRARFGYQPRTQLPSITMNSQLATRLLSNPNTAGPGKRSPGSCVDLPTRLVVGVPNAPERHTTHQPRW